MASDTGGVKPMPISDRFNNERERLLGMTDSERKFRHQWLKDQLLSESEPRFVPEAYRAQVNPIRRFYRFPLDTLYGILKPTLGHEKAFHVRYWIGKAGLTLTTLYLGYYYFKYNSNDWTKKGGWRIVKSRQAVEKGDPEFPKVSDKTKPSDYNLRGFNNSPI